MPDPTPRPSRLDFLSKSIGVVSLVVSLTAAAIALPIDARIKALKAKSDELDLALKQADADLKVLESDRQITLKLYEQVKAVIEKPGHDPREEEVVRVLVESLADDPFRWKLLQVLAVGAKDQTVQQNAAASSKFFEEEASRPAVAPAATVRAGAIAGSYNVDIFFAEHNRARTEPLARQVLALKSSGDTGRWRIRELPETINAQPGYRLTTNCIRYTPPDERPVAQAFVTALARRSVSLSYQEVAYPTPGYVSIFIVQ